MYSVVFLCVSRSYWILHGRDQRITDAAAATQTTLGEKNNYDEIAITSPLPWKIIPIMSCWEKWRGRFGIRSIISYLLLKGKTTPSINQPTNGTRTSMGSEKEENRIPFFSTVEMLFVQICVTHGVWKMAILGFHERCKFTLGATSSGPVKFVANA